MSEAAAIPNIDIRPDHWGIVRDILQKHVPQYAVWAFGSRARWTAKEYSDLDLAIITDKPLSLDVSASLSEEFSESDLPWKVDIVDWAATSESFRKVIERDRVVVQEAKGNWAMASDWSKLTLKQVGVSLIDCDHRTPAETTSGYPYVSIPQLRDGRITIEDARRISPDDFAEWTRKANPQANDVVLSRRCNPGESAYVPDGVQFALGQNLVLLRSDGTRVYPPFLRWLMRGPEWWRQVETYMNVGAVFTSLKCADIPKFELTIPPIDAQKRIADALEAIDKKIDLNRRINQTLEAMAQAIFKSWFVDFDPVKAKITAIEQGQDPLRAAMRAISGKTDAELDQMPREHHDQLAATAALFPDEMEESELGEIPKGWGIKSVSNIARFATGKIEVPSLTIENYISTENMLENRGGISHASSLPAVATVPTFKSGNILISNIRPYFKKIWFARFDGGRSNDVLCFEAKEDGCEEFLYNLLYQDDFFEFMMRTSKGAKMPRGDKDAIFGWKFPCASSELRYAFSERVRPFYSHIETLNQEARQLSQLRDTLLPKLLSGELSIENIPVEAAH